MGPSRFTKPVIAVAALLAPALAQAEQHEEAYNGATCIPYPPYNTTNGLPYTHLLFAYGQNAYCHFIVPNGWSVNDLSYVLFTGSIYSGTEPMRVRLCVYSSSTTSCGPERTLTPGSTVNWVSPPSTAPAYATGAYLSVRFPKSLSSLQQYFVYWYR